MQRYAVEFSPEALGHLEAIREWWLVNRQTSPGLFLRELRAAPRQAQRSPHTGKLYEAAGVRSIRRILLPKTSYHIYYWPDEAAQVVRVYAVWHGGRGEGPKL
jgi:plasmid stabilization system protein ParE